MLQYASRPTRQEEVERSMARQSQRLHGHQLSASRHRLCCAWPMKCRNALTRITRKYEYLELIVFQGQKTFRIVNCQKKKKKKCVGGKKTLGQSSSLKGDACPKPNLCVAFPYSIPERKIIEFEVSSKEETVLLTLPCCSFCPSSVSERCAAVELNVCLTVSGAALLCRPIIRQHPSRVECHKSCKICLEFT
jgi:hypothetical protein